MGKYIVNKAETIGREAFPRQGRYLQSRVSVSFDMQGGGTIGGEVVRDDIDRPYVGIIKLDDGRYVLMSECYYMPANESTANKE